MPQPYRDARDFLKALADMAEELRQAIVPMSEAERTPLLARLIDESEMIFGVWPEAGSPDGVGVVIIRGEEILPPLVGFETERDTAIAAIPCAGRDQALAARAAWGNQGSRPGYAELQTVEYPPRLPALGRQPRDVHGGRADRGAERGEGVHHQPEPRADNAVPLADPALSISAGRRLN